MWDGYFTFDGTEIINAARTEAYAENAGKAWLHGQYRRPDLYEFVGDAAPYTNPVTDNAPWYDPDIPESGDFLGFYPLNVDGIENSTRTSSVTEATIDGGTPGRLRHATKTPVFNGVIIGATQKGAQYGFDWLKRALLGAVCSPTLNTESSIGVDLTYFSSEPKRETPNDDPVGVVSALRRRLRKVVVNNGPTVSQRRLMPCGGMVIVCQFTAVAGSPYEYGDEKAIIQGYMDPSVANPYVPGITPGTADAAPTAWNEVECGTDTWEPIYDPTCPALVVPPTPPAVPLGCFTAPPTWDRRKVTVPADEVPLWGEVVPTITVRSPDGPSRTANVVLTQNSKTVTAAAATFTAADVGSTIESPSIPSGSTITAYTSGTSVTISQAATAGGTEAATITKAGPEVRNVRFRFYEDPEGTADPADAPCDFVGDAVVSYIPAGASLIFDAALQQVYVLDNLGRRRRADSLVFSTDGSPVEWPSLTCGYGYVLTIDTEQGDTPPVVGLSLTPKAV